MTRMHNIQLTDALMCSVERRQRLVKERSRAIDRKDELSECENCGKKAILRMP
jgi:DNA-directed RNA polymerase subunit RPC12/RpoP